MDCATVALHGFGERAELGLQQVSHQHPVAALAALPEPGGAVREELAGRGDPEGIGSVLLARDEGGRHGIEIPRRAGLEEGRPAGRAGVERIEQHVTVRIEEGLCIGAHLVVEHAALASGADLLDEVGDQHGLPRSGGAGDDGMAGLGTVRPGDAGDPVGSGFAAPQQAAGAPVAGGGRAHASSPDETSSPPRSRRPRLRARPNVAQGQQGADEDAGSDAGAEQGRVEAWSPQDAVAAA